MRSIFFTAVCFALSVTAFGAGCAAQTNDVADDVATDTSEDALGVAKLVGAYDVVDVAGAPVYPRLETLVFSSDKTFFASVDTGIRCFRAPCPSQGRLDGVFKQSRKTVTLSYARPDDTRAADVYTYAFVDGEKLTLTKSTGGAPTVLTLAKRDGTFCLEPSDCAHQGMIVPMCMGHFTCGAENRCGFRCGSEPKPRVCFTQADCGDEETCRPGLCKMFCLAGDDNCCAPSKCISVER